jgi:hypothetical protein
MTAIKRFFAWLGKILTGWHNQAPELPPNWPDPEAGEEEPDPEPEAEEEPEIIVTPGDPPPEEIPEGEGEHVDTGQEPGVGPPDGMDNESEDINDVIDEDGNPR